MRFRTRAQGATVSSVSKRRVPTMGTRSWTRFYKRSPRARQLVGVVYRQWDGHPEGVGRDIVEFVQKSTAGSAEAAMEAYLQLLEDTNTRHCVWDNHDPQSDDAIHIEWTYDIEFVEREGGQRAVCISILPQYGRIAPPHTSEWVVASGSADAIEAWINAGPYSIDGEFRTIEKIQFKDDVAAGVAMHRSTDHDASTPAHHAVATQVQALRAPVPATPLCAAAAAAVAAALVAAASAVAAAAVTAALYLSQG